jgi:hypothetical protein
MSPAIMQVLSLGLVWTSLHCAGMCGPIITGLDVAGVGRGLGAGQSIGRILVYQSGRATTLAIMGALAGLVGRGLAAVFEPSAAVFAILFGLAVLGAIIARNMPKKANVPGTLLRPALSIDSRATLHAPSGLVDARRPPSIFRRVRSRASELLRQLSLSNRLGAAWLTGVMLGFLPCMIVVWALGLAATTGSVFQGALVMVTLVALTTPMLVGVSLLPRVVARFLSPRARKVIPEVAMGLSGSWVVMVGLAGLELVPHVHLHAGDYMVMLW